ncbi:hypothetical protein OS242_19965 [Tumebacillus sp. DT12]|uniref:DUF2157 domain-containing protein n=1 Tax=Tumebacillus lacus TaxID=2995335 RepID=A0ABT3X873_9BACL|nr:hypothetical protein [Tumebacillus lacus]MCX7572187.1 hypothetical protein [Tumebacillus lacus]
MLRVRRFLTARVWLESAQAALLCTIVLVLNVLAGLIAFQFVYNFWLGVFFLALMPTWLACFGICFALRWRWHEISLGAFTALFWAMYLYVGDVESFRYRTVSSAMFATGGVLAVSAGYATGRLGHSILRGLQNAFNARAAKLEMKKKTESL